MKPKNQLSNTKEITPIYIYIYSDKGDSNITTKV